MNAWGADVTRMVMLTRKNDAPLDFDLAKVTEQSKDNPVFYVQYAHARVRSVMRKAEEMHLDWSDGAMLEDEAEFALARKIAEWPRLVETAARNHEPHRIFFYLYDLASEFHALWNIGNSRPALRFLHEGDPKATAGKIALPARCGHCNFQWIAYSRSDAGRGDALNSTSARTVRETSRMTAGTTGGSSEARK